MSLGLIYVNVLHRVGLYAALIYEERTFSAKRDVFTKYIKLLSTKMLIYYVSQNDDV